jgi:hypothetical protein
MIVPEKSDREIPFLQAILMHLFNRIDWGRLGRLGCDFKNTKAI